MRVQTLKMFQIAIILLSIWVTGELPVDWHAHGNMASLMDLDRGFVFPGKHGASR